MAKKKPFSKKVPDAVQAQLPLAKKKGAKKILTHKALGDGHLKQLVEQNFLEYASYVIRDRAIPNLDDGLKPVQRRIMHSLKMRDDGKFIKVANIAGYCMQFHPHGDASIIDALVNIANKGFLIEGQGNFGNLYTGDPAAAGRYIECRLTDLARKEIFNKELTEFIPSYDGRNQEPVTLPSKLPLLLMQGAEGIAVGLATKILPHNFIELLEAMILALRKKPFQLFPDFLQGGIMDASEYEDGHGKIRVRATIEKKDKSGLVITQLPFGTNTESIIASIEKAAKKKKIKVLSIQDFTAENVEILIKLSPGEDQDKAMQALYALTDCEISISSNLLVIDRNRPRQMTVTEVLKHNAKRLREILEQELIHEKGKILDEVHYKTLVQIFVEERIYRDIEEKKSWKDVQQAVLDGFKPFKKKLRRPVSLEDVEMLLKIPIRKISRFDIDKNQQEIGDLLKRLEEIEKLLKNLTRYAVKYIEGLIKTYKGDYSRKTKVQSFEVIDVNDVMARDEYKIHYDKPSGYLGHAVRGGDQLFECSSLDKIMIVWKDGRYKMLPPPDKLFVNKDMIYSAMYDRDKLMTAVYTFGDTVYYKRFTFGGAIQNKEYRIAPEKSRILFYSDQGPEELFVKFKPAKNQRVHQQVFDLKALSPKSAKAKGNQMTSKKVASISSKEPRNWERGEPSPDDVLDL